MNPTIEILLKRMESNPEEFNYNINTDKGSRWGEIYERYSHCLSVEDREAYTNGIYNLRLKDFHEEVLKELLIPKDKESDEGKWLARQRVDANGMGMGGQTLVSSSGATGTWGASTLSIMETAMKRQQEDRKVLIEASKTKGAFKKAMKLDMSVEEYVRTRK